MLQDSITRAQADAAEMKAKLVPELEHLVLRGEIETGAAQQADLNRAVAIRARFVDLVVLPKAYGTDCGMDLEVFVEASMFEVRA
ncbi:MAG: universal stress protein, partial [Rhodobacteraceae bacterium]|nr:universal stress protein [Paracoccaceae bacterium]